MDRFDSELMKGTGATLILALLAENELHGYALIQELRRRSSDRFRMNEGALYPLLHRLEREGWLASRTRQQGARSRHCYRLTQAGRKALDERRSEWRAYAEFVEDVLEGSEKT
ncbi:MAG: helix-turn-helix transcriptional regulator [Planctomycetota bacterium]